MCMYVCVCVCACVRACVRVGEPLPYEASSSLNLQLSATD